MKDSPQKILYLFDHLTKANVSNIKPNTIIHLKKMEISLLFSFIFFLIISIFTILKFLKPLNKKLKLPPGPPKLPIIGNIHQLASHKTPPHHLLQNLARVYGPIMHLQLGEVPTVIISSADVAKVVMRAHDANFANRPRLIVAKDLYYDYSDIGLAPYGEYWRQVRKIATLELFTARRVQSFRAIREEEATMFVESIASMAAQGGSSVNLSERVFGLIFDITSRTTFNKKGKEQEAFRALTGLMSKLFSGFSIADLYPSIKLLHSIGGMKKTVKYMVDESNRILDPIIQEHKSNMIQGKVDQEDLVDVLLKFHREVPNDIDFSLTNNNIKAIILEIFGAGTETSSTTIEWVISELIKNPKAMERAQKEVREVYKGKETIDETNLDELKYLKLVIKETLRLHPPAPLLIPRESIEQCRICSYDIPPKTRVMVNARAIGRDPNYWVDANTFKPERFETCHIDYKGNDFEFIPFGAGRRMCPGMALGIVNMELPIAMLLYHFDWNLPNGIEGESLDMDELFGITVRRKNDLLVVPILYKYSCLR